MFFPYFWLSKYHRINIILISLSPVYATPDDAEQTKAQCRRNPTNLALHLAASRQAYCDNSNYLRQLLSLTRVSLI